MIAINSTTHQQDIRAFLGTKRRESDRHSLSSIIPNDRPGTITKVQMPSGYQVCTMARLIELESRSSRVLLQSGNGIPLVGRGTRFHNDP